MIVVTVLVVGATPAAMRAQPTRSPHPNAPRLLVGNLRSSDKKLSSLASDEVRTRLAHDFPMRLLTIISSFDYRTVIEFDGDQELAPGDLASIAMLLRTDEFIDGTITRTATGFLIDARLILTRDATLVQPLPPAAGGQIATAAARLSKHVLDVLKQLEFEKKCLALGREGRVSEAIAAARRGVAVYPRATLARLCELQVRVGAKQAPDSIIAIAQEIITIDPRSRRALTYSAQAYTEKRDQHRANAMLLQLLASDPTDRRIVVDVVNAFVATSQWDRAAPIIAQAIKDNPGDVLLMKLGFQVFMASGDRQRGVAAGEEMVKMDSSRADSAYFMTLITSYRADGAYAKAVEVGRRAVGKFPNVLVFQTTLAEDLRRSGQGKRDSAGSADSIVVLASAEHSTFRQPLRQVIRDRAAFVRSWEQVRTHQASPPEVDFARDEVIVIALGQKRSTGYTARVLRVGSTEGRDSIFVELLEPGGLCGTGPEVQTPVLVVRHHRTARPGPSQPAVFVESVRAFSCR
jgi:tetratricopeptide (TPR) repeat protein